MPCENFQALADGILSVQSLSSEDRALMGKKGRTRIEENYSMEALLYRYEKLLHEVMTDI